MTLTPPFAYYGGKTTLAPRIADLLPAHRHYVEPFAGSLAVLLAKQPSKLETVNDLDQDLVTFWRVLRERPDELAAVATLTPHARAEHISARDLTVPDDLERARRVWVLLSQGRTGTLRTTGWRFYADPAGTSTPMPGYLQGYVERLPRAAWRLRQVSLECRPALDVIADYGQHAEVCIYADPPYLGSTRSSLDPKRRRKRDYAHDLTTEQAHAALAEVLQNTAAAVILSGYASPLYDELYAGWDRLEVRVARPSGNRAGHAAAAATEVLWSNRPITRQLELDGGAA